MNIGNSLYGVFAYSGQKVNEGEGKLLASNKIFDHGTGTVDIARATANFESYLPARMRTEKPIIHISLNPHPEDKLTDFELTNIARNTWRKSVMTIHLAGLQTNLTICVNCHSWASIAKSKNVPPFSHQ